MELTLFEAILTLVSLALLMAAMFFGGKLLGELDEGERQHKLYRSAVDEVMAHIEKAKHWQAKATTQWTGEKRTLQKRIANQRKEIKRLTKQRDYYRSFRDELAEGVIRRGDLEDELRAERDELQRQLRLMEGAYAEQARLIRILDGREDAGLDDDTPETANTILRENDDE